MENQDSNTVLTPEQEQKAFIDAVEAKATSLKEVYGVVTPIIITDDDGVKVVGYFQKPSFDTIMYCTDQILAKQITMAAEQVMKDCLIASESDARINSGLRQDAYLKAAFTMETLKFVKPYTNEYKKK